MTSDADGEQDPFDALMVGLNSPVAIITTAAGGARAGCVVGFHAQCGMDPPMYAVWLSKANHTYRVGALADVFAVHFLSDDDMALAELFGTLSGDEIDKFERCSWTEGPGGVPLLDDCPDRIVGRRLAWLDPGSDHVCLTLDPIEATAAGTHRWLTFQQVAHLEASHPAQDRQRPHPDE